MEQTIDKPMNLEEIIPYILGLDYDSLISTTNDAALCAHNRGIKADIYSPTDRNTSSLHEYSPIISFLKSFYDSSIKDKTIVEIGAGTQGIRALSYLESLGAKVFAVDKEDALGKGFLNRSKVEHIKARWEDISKFFGKESVDIIFTNYMQTSPHREGIFDNHPTDKTSWQHGLNEFEKHIAQNMHEILRPQGLYINKFLDLYLTEYVSHHNINFHDYKYSRFPIEGYNLEDEPLHFELRMGNEIERPRTFGDLPSECVKNYPLNPEDKNVYFGKELIVFQKKMS